MQNSAAAERYAIFKFSNFQVIYPLPPVTLLCVAIFVTDFAQAQRDIAAAAEAGADLVELRVDTFTDLDAVGEIVRASLLPAIVTCRPAWEGGQSELDDQHRLPVLEQAALAGASYIDVELESYRRSANLRQKVHFAAGSRIDQTAPRERRAGLIVSSHDFKSRPSKLSAIVAEMNDLAGDVNKIVWTARTIRDNLEAFEMLRDRQKPTIAICMGEAGLISRVLAKKFGSLLSFASLDAESGTAPGQVSIADMKRLYRWDAINPATRVYGVVGSPVGHSMSPAIHNASFERVKFDGVYLPLLVNPGYESFKAFMETFLAMSELHLSGLSITIPHKENALRYLREKGDRAQIEPLAESIGAVNTIIVDRSDGMTRLRGMNTDSKAIVDALCAGLGAQPTDLASKRFAVIGAGGTGRTAVASLAKLGATVEVYNRTRERADILAAEFTGESGKVVAADMDKLCDSSCDIYLNTTSIGMHPNVHASPFGEAPPKLSTESLVFDAVYNPMRTKLLIDAEKSGAKTVGGVEMFVRQAAAQFEAWTGMAAPVDLMRKVVEKRLAGS